MARTKYVPSASYKQESLMKDLMEQTYNSHNSLKDVVAFQELYYKKLSIEYYDFPSALFPVAFASLSRSLQPLVDAKAISTLIKVKLARSSLGLSHLALAFKRDSDQGIDLLFKQPCGLSNEPRITKSKLVIAKVNKYLASTP